MINAIIDAISEVEYITISDACLLLQSLAILQKLRQGIVLPKLN